MQSAVKAVSGLLGGLALFLYGMDAMSRAMEAGAGPGLRRVLARATRTPLRGALAGAAATAVLQSSSAVTVTVIGFVSAGLLGLPQAIAVIFGANVGTTVTAQLTALSPGGLVYPVLFAGYLLDAAGRGDRPRALGRAAFSFGLLFLGVDIMGGALEPVAASPRFAALLSQAGSSPGLGLVMGAALTAAVQSSSAAIALLQKLAAQAGPDGAGSALGLLGALPILLGSNIGTTVTALIAAAGQGRDARRVALAHVLFNLGGALIFLPLLPLFAHVTTLLSPRGPECAVVARQIANAHALFNLVSAAAWLPFTDKMAALVTWAVPDRTREKSPLAGGG